MFLNLDKKPSKDILFIDDSRSQMTYGEAAIFVDDFHRYAENRTLIAIICRNTIGSAAGYIACMSHRIVPLMIGYSVDTNLRNELIQRYSPEYLWAPSEIDLQAGYEKIFSAYGYSLIKTGLTPPKLYNDLSLLLTTSGSTGSPKLARHSYINVEANAENIAKFFALDKTERAMLDLPMQYTYGLSVLNSHIFAGATVILSERHVVEIDYWNLFKECKATSITGVPYCYEMLKKLRFFRMKLPSLRTLSQGGGKLSEELQKEFAEYAHENGIRFFITYGATEGTARMAYLPPELAGEKLGSIGNAIPGGKLSVADENGNEITEPGVLGEMVYRGPNVTLGYAEKSEDLALGDERHGVLYTGDMVKTDSDGYFYIVGRKKRFLKLFGSRVSLDEIENMLKIEFGVDVACVGKDDEMKIFLTSQDTAAYIIPFLTEKTHINKTAFRVNVISAIPKNDAGKTLYAKLS